MKIQEDKNMYTFKKSAEPESAMDYSSRICNVYDFDADYNKNMALFPGQLKFLFGEPSYMTEDFDNLLSYIIEATDKFGNTLLLSVYSAGSGPAIGGFPEKNETAYQKAASELASYIRQADASDYEYEGYYMDGPSKINMGVKNGKPYYEEIEMADEETQEVFKKWYN